MSVRMKRTTLIDRKKIVLFVKMKHKNTIVLLLKRQFYNILFFDNLFAIDKY